MRATLESLRKAFDSDSVQVKNVELRRAYDEVARLRVGLADAGKIALSGFRGDTDESHALSAINNHVVAILKD